MRCITVACHPFGAARCVHFCHSGMLPFIWGKVCTFLYHGLSSFRWEGVFIYQYHTGLSPFRWGKVCTFWSQWSVALQVGQSVYISVTVVCRPSGGARCTHLYHSGLSPFRWGKVCTSLSQWSVALQVGQDVSISITVVCHPSGGARCVHLYHSGQSNKSCLICEEVKSLFVAKTYILLSVYF